MYLLAAAVAFLIAFTCMLLALHWGEEWHNNDARLRDLHERLTRSTVVGSRVYERAEDYPPEEIDDAGLTYI